MVLIAFLRYRKDLLRMLRNPKDVVILVIFSIAGLMFIQVSFIEAIAYTNSGTATILQYTGLVLIMIVNCIIARRLPQKKEVLSVLLVIVGTFLLATHGNFHSLAISGKGLFWGLTAAVAMTSYTMIPRRIIGEYGAIPVIGCGMLISGVVLSLFSGALRQPLSTDPTFQLAFWTTVIVGSILSYTLYLGGVNLCGPVRGSLASSIEPVSATFWMVVWLGEPFYPVEAVGFLCIFATIFLLAQKEKAPQSE